ncbi:MAG: methyltransferase domain-containing protein, partial [Thermodesulfobacteriota bacterium]
RQSARFELNELKQHAVKLNQALTEQDSQITSLNQQLAALYHSTSWRITGPLRIVGHQSKRYRREGLALIKRGFKKKVITSVSRVEELTKFATREGRGIEIGPWCYPVVPKRLGYNCLILDIFDTDTLRQRATEDPGIPDDLVTHIEEVDLIGSSTEIAKLVCVRNELDTFDYIISSHNFEHLPDPIRFLQGCSEVLKPGGILTMAIPDRRGCFDCFRPHSTLAQLLEAYFEQRDRPTQAQIFERWSLSARSIKTGDESISFPIETDPASVVPFHSLQKAFLMWQEFIDNPDDTYRDTHCWVFTPASCELILSDLSFLGLIALEVFYISSGQNEFFVHLKKKPAKVDVRSTEQQEHFYTNRQRLMLRTYTESRP